MIAISLPIRIQSEANMREHWAAKAGRVKAQRKATWVALQLAGSPPTAPLVVTMTRIAPRMLDTDNLAGGFKAVRDEIAKWLGTGDHPGNGIEWLYEQRKGKAGEYWAEVAIDAPPSAAA